MSCLDLEGLGCFVRVRITWVRNGLRSPYISSEERVPNYMIYRGCQHECGFLPIVCLQERLRDSIIE